MGSSDAASGSAVLGGRAYQPDGSVENSETLRGGIAGIWWEPIIDVRQLRAVRAESVKHGGLYTHQRGRPLRKSWGSEEMTCGKVITMWVVDERARALGRGYVLLGGGGYKL